MFLLLASSESTSSPWSGLVWGVVGFLASRVVYDLLNNWILKRRLLKALLVDCAVTLNKMDGILGDVEKGARQPCQLVPTIENVRRLVSGIVLSAPTNDVKALLPLLRADESHDVIHFHDRWARLIDYEKRFTTVYDKLLAVFVKESSAASQQVAAEYWEQAVGMLREMLRLSHELMFYSCCLIRQCWPMTDPRIPQLCQHRWSDWRDWRRDRDAGEEQLSQFDSQFEEFDAQFAKA